MTEVVIPSGKGFDRFNGNKAIGGEPFCPAHPYKTFLIGLCSKLQDSFFFVNILQFAIVTLMYVNVGKGRYWKILFYAAIGGFVGCIIENGTSAFLCTESELKKERFMVIPFFLTEFCWVVEEYSIPFLNLTKMKAFSKGKATKIVNYFIILLFAVFVGFRFSIGYFRMSSGLLTTNKTRQYHSYAFSVMALADLTCTIGILYFVTQHNKQEAVKNSSINHYIKRSSYIILVCVDIVGVCLALFNALIEKFGIAGEYLIPFHCIKCAFILILSCDALLFKYSVNTSSINNDSSNYRYGESYYNSSYKSYNNKSRNNYNIDVVSNKSLNNYSYNDYKSEPSLYQTKSIVKNYTNIKPSPTATLFDAATPDSEKTYPAQSFGFLYQQQRDY